MIKKFIALLLIAIFSFSSTFAYSTQELDTKKNNYKKIIKTKFADKLEKISKLKLKKILILIDEYIEKYENNESISDSKKLKKIALLTAFKEIINEKLEDEYGDIKNIFKKVNKVSKVIAISDLRCLSSECKLTPIIEEIRKISQYKNADFEILDFADKRAKEIMEKNGIKKLPAIIFEDNSSVELKTYLNLTDNDKYSLSLGATFDPYAKMSDKGFKILDKKIIEKIKKESYIKGNKNSEILWLEYSDMECPFCAKLHNSGTKDELEKKYGIKLSYSLQHFPLGFHKNALPAAEALECLAKQKGEKSFFELENIVFSSKNSNIDFIIEKAVELGANKKDLEKCIKNNEFSSKIENQQKQGVKLFNISGTPGNVLINTKTGEYEVINGAYPTESFISVIDKLLK